MRSARILALSLALLICVFLPACGGGGGGNNNPTQTLTITSTVFPQATVNVPYTFIIQATGGSGTYTWSLSGTLPTGLSFNGTTATLSGTPTVAGTFPLTAQVMDAKNDVASQPVTLIVGGAIGIVCNSCSKSSPLTLPAGSPGVPYSASFSATGGIAPYTWCVQEPNNGPCDNGSGGALPAGLTLSASGVISGTPTTPTPSPLIFIIQAKDSEATPSVGTAQIMMSIFGVITASLPAGEIYIPYGDQQLTLAGGVKPYTWCVMESDGSCDNGSGGALPPGITLSSACTTPGDLMTCIVSGTPTTAGAYNFTVKVTDSETPPAVATAPFSIDIGGIGNGALKGNYVFTFTGYNNGTPVLMAGAFVADGNGNITGGELDLNNGTGEATGNCLGFTGQSGPQQQTIMAAPSSTYSIAGSGNGLGTLTLVTSDGTYNFRVSIRGDGSGSLIQDNTDPNTRGSGTIRVQTTGVGMADFAPPATLAVGLHGADPSGNRYVAAGQIAMEDNQGDFSGPAMDVDDGGTPSQPTFDGTFAIDIDGYGRGCYADMTFNGTLHYHYAYYIVSTNEVAILSTDPVGGTNNANLTLWSAERQIVGATGFNNAELATPNVVELSAQDTSGASDVSVGLFVGQGTSSHTCQSGNFDPATFTYDENAGGTLNQQQSTTGQYCVDQHTGRVTLQGFNGAWMSNPPVFYLGGNDPGSVVGTDAAGTAGTVEGQNVASYNLTSISGGYWGGTAVPAIPAITDSVASLYANGNGNIIGTQYTSASNGPGGPNNLSYTYTVTDNGRGVLQNNNQTSGILYIVAAPGSSQFQSKFILLPTGNNPALNIFQGPPAQ